MEVGELETALQSKPSIKIRLKTTASKCHQKIPLLRLLPGPAVAIILFLAFVNILVWAAARLINNFGTKSGETFL